MRPGSLPSSTRTTPSAPCDPVLRRIVLSASLLAKRVFASCCIMPGPAALFCPKPPCGPHGGTPGEPLAGTGAAAGLPHWLAGCRCAAGALLQGSGCELPKDCPQEGAELLPAP